MEGGFNEEHEVSLNSSNAVKKALDKGLLPAFRGLKLSDDDKIRQHATQQIRSYFKLDFKNFKRQFNINFKEYFSNEIKFLDELEKDGLVEIQEESILVTEIGQDFVQNIMNIFDKFDPPTKSYNERLETVRKAKEAQAAVQDQIS